MSTAFALVKIIIYLTPFANQVPIPVGFSQRLKWHHPPLIALKSLSPKSAYGCTPSSSTSLICLGQMKLSQTKKRLHYTALTIRRLHIPLFSFLSITALLTFVPSLNQIRLIKSNAIYNGKHTRGGLVPGVEQRGPVRRRECSWGGRWKRMRVLQSIKAIFARGAFKVSRHGKPWPVKFGRSYGYSDHIQIVNLMIGLSWHLRQIRR